MVFDGVEGCRFFAGWAAGFVVGLSFLELTMIARRTQLLGDWKGDSLLGVGRGQGVGQLGQ